MPSRVARRTWIGSFRAAFSGLVLAFSRGRNFRIQVAVGYGAMLLAFWIGLPTSERVFVILAIALVLAAEIFNTAVEVLVDLATSDFHPLARSAKDLAAGAVLLAAMAALAVGAALFGPHIGALPTAFARRWKSEPALTGVEVAAGWVLVLAAAFGRR